MNIKLPEKHTKKLYIYIGYGTYNLNDIHIYTFELPIRDKPEDWGAIFLKTIDIELDFSDIQINDEMVVKNIVAHLEERKKAIELQASVEIQKIQDQLNKYLAIEYNPEA